MSKHGPVFAVASDGRRFRIRFDGYQDFRPLSYGIQEQFTALEEIPGLAPIGGTMYALSVTRSGYRVEAAQQPKENQ
jgi:hypothetical protein